MSGARDRYHHGNLRAALLAAAGELLDGHGVDGVTIRAVARAAGVAHSAPANHFRDRKALLTALAAEVFGEIAAAIAAELDRSAGPGGAGPRAQVKALGRAWIQFGLDHPNRYRLLWRQDCLDGADAALNAAMDRIYEPLVALLGDGKAARGGVPVSAETRAIALWSALHGYLSMRLDGSLVAKADEVSGAQRHEALLDAVLDGIGPAA